MGNIMALPTAPPGSVVVVVESAEPCTCEPCCGRLWDVTQQKPPFVDLSSGEWSQFVNEMDKLTKSYKNEGRASLFFLGFIGSFVLFHPAFGILRQNLGATQKSLSLPQSAGSQGRTLYFALRLLRYLHLAPFLGIRCQRCQSEDSILQSSHTRESHASTAPTGTQ